MVKKKPTYNELQRKIEELAEENKRLEQTGKPEASLSGTKKGQLRSENQYREAVENSPDLIYRTNMEGVVVFISPSVYRLSGYTKEEAIGMEIADSYADPKKRNDFLTLLSKTGVVKNFEARLLRKDGSVWWASTNAHYYKDSQGNLLGVEGICRDVSYQKQIERELKESKNQYKQLSDATFEAIFLSEKGICISQNRSAEKMFGYSDTEAQGRPGIEWIHPDHRGIVDHKIISGYEGVYQSMALRKDGTNFPCEIQARMMRVDGRKIRITALRDIADRIKAQEEKLTAQKFAADQAKHAMVGQIAGKMAHDFNNVLSIILGNTQLSMADCEDPNIMETLELIFNQTLRGKNLTKNLVVFAKDQELKQQYFYINKKIDIVLNLLKKDLDGVDLIREDTSTMPELFADPGMIEHMLVNLTQNSIHALSKTADPKIWIRTYNSDTRICFEIEDNGCGIPKEHLERIYDPAFTLKGHKDETRSYHRTIKGTGYGMSNVKKYIEQHKGTIAARSEFGTGTTFTIYLPVFEKELTEVEKIKVSASTQQTGKHILLVEDEKDISNVQSRILTRGPCYHKVDVAATGREALELLDRNSYDAISLDYMLPQKINGMDIYHHVRVTNKTIPILFISGNLQFLESIRELKENDPWIDHISKPCMNLDYMESINALMEQAAT